MPTMQKGPGGTQTRGGTPWGSAWVSPWPAQPGRTGRGCQGLTAAGRLRFRRRCHRPLSPPLRAVGAGGIPALSGQTILSVCQRLNTYYAGASRPLAPVAQAQRLLLHDSGTPGQGGRHTPSRSTGISAITLMGKPGSDSGPWISGQSRACRPETASTIRSSGAHLA